MAGSERRGPDVPDGIELHKDGTATLSIDNDRWRMRRPKLGEFRKLRELLHSREDERLRRLGEFGELPAAPAKDAPNDEKVAYTAAVNAQQRAITDVMQDLNIDWLEQALTMLCEREPPPADDWPSGMAESEMVTKLVEHWRAVPLRSGGG